MGLLVPSFTDIWYYFKLDVIKFSKFTYSMLTLVAFCTLLLGTMLYNRFLKDKEFRDLMKWAIYITFFSSIVGLLFVLRINLLIGINDLVFIIFTSVVTDTLVLSLRLMP